MTRIAENILLAFWGKTKDRNPNATRDEYHPLLFHLLDVANSARELWCRSPLRFRRRVARALGVSVEEAERIVAFLAGIHDLGKASAFQTKAPSLWDYLSQNGFTFPAGRTPKEHLHSYVTADEQVLPRLLVDTTVCGWTVRSCKLAATLAGIVGAHHGKFPTGAEMGPDTLGGKNWDAVREELARALANAIWSGGNADHPTTELLGAALTDNGVGAYLTGLIAVADWIGSTTLFWRTDVPRPVPHFLFTLEPRCSLAKYVSLSCTRAADALTAFGFDSVPVFAEAAPFEEIVWREQEDENAVRTLERFAPNAMQDKVTAFARRAGNRPYLLIVEDAMGGGKTEAALYAVDLAMTHRSDEGESPHGFYVALPTQATGNAMMRRVITYLRHRGHTGKLNLQLVHGGAEFNPDFEALLAPVVVSSTNAAATESDTGGNKGQPADGDAMRLAAEGWFTTKKHALLAPFGVGTIDQTLMGILQNKHWFVRLFGLAGKVVVFDEVHAYDAYTDGLLETLVAWLRELDCTVILLSATLPRDKRESLMQAYRPNVATVSATYPRVTFLPKAGPVAECVSVPSDGSPQSVELRFEAADSATMARLISEDIPDGSGCAAVICNTVARAQQMYRELLKSDLVTKLGWEVMLFHARTTVRWRQDRETEVLTHFGKGSRPEQRRKKILIATQVIEQSLDLDFDWMASEMAPVDLLLQRMGRLWRHEGRLRPAGSTRRFTVLVYSGDGKTDALPIFPRGTTLVYAPYILLRSYAALLGRNAVSLPDDIETLVQTVYDDTEPPAPTPQWARELAKAKLKLGKSEHDDLEVARENGIGKPDDATDFQTLLSNKQMNFIEGDDPTLHKTMRMPTRLGDPTVLIVCLRGDAGGVLRPFCAPPDSLPVDLGAEPTTEQVRALRESSVSVARPKAFFHGLVARPVPGGWQKNAHLRFARHLVFESDGTASEILYSEKGVPLIAKLDLNEGLFLQNEQETETAEEVDE